ncbi:hypothetical protein, partial [Actinomadura citrea]|uniref:hypothetical protein n=1 Tax=Actinomadura citrea TaxID=46158 RepID=UPI003CE58B42
PSDAIATIPVVAGLRSGLRLLPWRVLIEPARSGPAPLEPAFGRDRDHSGCRGVLWWLGLLCPGVPMGRRALGAICR